MLCAEGACAPGQAQPPTQGSIGDPGGGWGLCLGDSSQQLGCAAFNQEPGCWRAGCHCGFILTFVVGSHFPVSKSPWPPLPQQWDVQARGVRGRHRHPREGSSDSSPRPAVGDGDPSAAGVFCGFSLFVLLKKEIINSFEVAAIPSLALALIPWLMSHHLAPGAGALATCGAEGREAR